MLSGCDYPSHCGSFQRARRHVRLWRSEFARGDVEALKAYRRDRPATGKDRSRTARRRASARVPVADRPNWTIPRFLAEIEAREASRSASRSCPRRSRKLPLAAAPAHAERPLHCRRDRTRGTAPSTAQGSGRSRDIILLYATRARPYAPLSGAACRLARADLRVPAPRQAKKVAITRLTRSCHAPVECAY